MCYYVANAVLQRILLSFTTLNWWCPTRQKTVLSYKTKTVYCPSRQKTVTRSCFLSLMKRERFKLSCCFPVDSCWRQVLAIVTANCVDKTTGITEALCRYVKTDLFWSSFGTSFAGTSHAGPRIPFRSFLGTVLASTTYGDGNYGSTIHIENCVVLQGIIYNIIFILME